MITHVAIRFRDKVYSLPPPNRHNDVIRMICETTDVTHVNVRGDDQGFLIDGELYCRRKPALRHAVECNQIRTDRPSTGLALGKLYSEDVW